MKDNDQITLGLLVEYINHIDEPEFTTLEDLYRDGYQVQYQYPEKNEIFWDYVTFSDLTEKIEIKTLESSEIVNLLLYSFDVEKISDLTRILKKEQREIVDHYKKSSNLSKEIIVLCGKKIIDGNHRALSAALTKQSIRSVNVADID